MTDGRVFIMEDRGMVPGGAPRHVHYEQEEWVSLLEGGEVIMEIGEQKIRLRPGGSVLAPRKVPHVWACIGEQPGRMLFVFTPAAKIESFFEETNKPDAKVTDPQRFEAHGMKILGPPSDLDRTHTFDGAKYTSFCRSEKFSGPATAHRIQNHEAKAVTRPRYQTRPNNAVLRKVSDTEKISLT